ILDRIAARSDLKPRWIGSDLVVEVPPGPPEPPATPPGVELDHRGWTLSGSDPGAARAADGDLATHWVASTPERETALRIDLRAEHVVPAVPLRMGAHATEYPRSYSVWASRDGASWTELGGAPATLPPFASYRRDHRNVEVPLAMEPGTARYLEIRVPP